MSSDVMDKPWSDVSQLEKDFAALRKERDEWKNAYDSSNIFQLVKEREELRTKLSRYERALNSLKIGDARSGCWCAIAIGDPRMTGHSANCKMAREALEDAD